MGTSYTRSTKIGTNKRVVRRTSASGKTTTTFVTRTNLGNGDYLTTRNSESHLRKPKAVRTTSNKRSNSRSSANGEAGVMLSLGLFVAIIAGFGWLFGKLFGWIFSDAKETEEQEVVEEVQ